MMKIKYSRPERDDCGMDEGTRNKNTILVKLQVREFLKMPVRNKRDCLVKEAVCTNDFELIYKFYLIPEKSSYKHEVYPNYRL